MMRMYVLWRFTLLSACQCVYVSMCLCLCSLCIVCVKEQGEVGVDDANVSTIEVHTHV